MNLHKELTECLFVYFIKSKNEFKKNSIIKKHTDKLFVTGEFSFPLDIKNWQQFLKDSHKIPGNTIFSYKCLQNAANSNGEEELSANEDVNELLNSLVLKSHLWTFPIDRAVLKNNRAVLYLNRQHIMKTITELVLTNPKYGQICRTKLAYIRIGKREISDRSTQSISDYRCELLIKVIENLIKYLSLEAANENADKIVLNVTNNANTDKMIDSTVVNIVSGYAREPLGENRRSTIMADNYIRLVYIAYYALKIAVIFT